MNKRPIFKFLFVFGLVLLFLAPYLALAQAIGPERVLIRNAVLFDPSGVVEDKVVNILLRDNKIDIVTEDKIARE